MDMIPTTLGWKDILRPIRDGYRHLFPSPDTGPSPEERERQREWDRLKGFAYFDTVDQLEAWTEASTDALQRANTPIFPRSKVIGEDDQSEKANAMIVHDYAGNYHDYEACHSTGVDEESYSCQYLQFVECFVYFSHKLACVPPPTWTNALHRNGVEVMGTVLVEPQTKGIERLLHHEIVSGGPDNDIHFPMAKKLAAIATHFGFDGWLMNIEKPFPKEAWDASLLEMFLQQLRQELGRDKRLIWYDAITKSNKIAYQNALTLQNLPFSRACGNILTNYSWTEDGASSSKKLALEQSVDPRSVYFGIDVWAQNITKLTHPRVTYPKENGGGTYTGIAVTKLAELGLSAVVFAPAWTFEHFPGNGCTVEKVVWDGYVPLEDLDCSCGPSRQHHRHPYNPASLIVRSAQQFSAGSDNLFYTDFTRAFGNHTQEESRLYGDKKLHSQLGCQSVLPYVPHSRVMDDSVTNTINVVSQRLEDLPERTQLVVEVKSCMPLSIFPDKVYVRWLPLFQPDMPADGSLWFKARIRYTIRRAGATARFYLKIANAVTFFPLEEVEDIQTIEGTVQQHHNTDDSDRLSAIGVHFCGPQMQDQTVRILEIVDICITPRVSLERSNTCRITDLRIEHRQNGETKHWRVCWDFHDSSKELSRSLGLPYSEITGPFSHFLIEVDGLSARAYVLEWIVNDSLLELFADGGVEVFVNGIGFDGRKLAGAVARLYI